MMTIWKSPIMPVPAVPSCAAISGWALTRCQIHGPPPVRVSDGPKIGYRKEVAQAPPVDSVIAGFERWKISADDACRFIMGIPLFSLMRSCRPSIERQNIFWQRGVSASTSANFLCYAKNRAPAAPHRGDFFDASTASTTPSCWRMPKNPECGFCFASSSTRRRRSWRAPPDGPDV